MVLKKQVRVGERGQLTIPKEMRENENIEPNELVELLDGGGTITIRKMGEKSPENKILEILQDIGFNKEDWKDIRRRRDME